ncbi:MAG: radical SAM family heme chaperone HemW [Cyanobacteria bacterium P01_A01_bin.135]
MQSLLPTAAYLHIPFCRRRCYYCDFAVSIVGDRPPTARLASAQPTQPEQPNGHGSQAIAAYVDILCQEIALTPPGPPLETVFFGGGTPSLLSSQQLGRILGQLAQRGIAPGAEVSIEVDPDTITDGMLGRYRDLGINRISLGVQAFQDKLLTACGRTHRRHHIDRALAQLRSAGLTNVSLDLISGLPHQTLEDWTESLQMAIATGVPHLSVYDLIVEPRTAFSRWYSPGEAPLPPEETTARMYRQAQVLLTAAGYEHYEVSNYAKPGFQCRHNRVYWQNLPFYGFGMGAASYVQQRRLTRPRTQAGYRQWVARLPTAASTGASVDSQPDSPTEQLLDTLMLGLRLAEGLSLDSLAQRFGPEAVRQIIGTLTPFTAKGWVRYSPSETASAASPMPGEHHRIYLSDPEGFLFSNVILSALFDALDD